jgi:hypothetical protein
MTVKVGTSLVSECSVIPVHRQLERLFSVDL